MKTGNIHARFFALLKRLPFFTKGELVWKYSHMLTDSLSQFYEADRQSYYTMISDMQQMVDEMDNNNDRTIKKLRSAILHRLQKHGVDTTNWSRVNQFLEQPRIAGKRLYDITEEEMRTLIKKLERILEKDAAQEQEITRLSQLN
jgi:hypothetical protein